MKKIITLSTAVLLSIAISGCSLLSNGEKQKPQTPPKTPAASEKIAESEVTIYEVTDDFLKVRPLKIRVTTGDDLHLAALRRAISYDRNKKYPVCPENLSVTSVTVSDGVAVADFSKELSNLTLTEFPDVKEVKFLQEGAPVTKLSGHSDMTRTLTRNELIIRK